MLDRYFLGNFVQILKFILTIEKIGKKKQRRGTSFRSNIYIFYENEFEIRELYRMKKEQMSFCKVQKNIVLWM